MGNVDLNFIHRRISKIHIGTYAAFWMYTLVQLLEEYTTVSVIGLGLTAAAFLINVMFDRLKIWKKERIWTCLRVIELIIVSFFFIRSINSFSAIFMMLLLLTMMFELIISYDFTDTYSRSITIILTALPLLGGMIGQLFLYNSKQNEIFGIVCIVMGLLFFVSQICSIIAKEMVSIEQELFHQQRLADSTKEANEALRIQQEKVKKANEQLGIQKIELEAAYHRINNVNAEMMLQYDILKYISSSLELEALLTKITNSLLEEIGLDICAIILLPEVAANRDLLYKIHSRISRDAQKHLSKCVESGCLLSFMHQKKVFVDNNVQENKFNFIKDKSIGSLLIIPLIKEENVIGAMLFGHSLYDFFGENRAFFETIVAQLGIALHNVALYEAMQQMAVCDSLTGIYNRRHLNVLLDKFSDETADKAVSVALFDIDYFKKINDTYGHLFGDQVIKSIASLANETALKYEGFAARYGGEEFVLVFPGKCLEECYSMVKEMRDNINNLILDCNGEAVRTRVSVGITSFPETCSRYNELLSRADWAMYFSKKNGRDQITIDSDEIIEKSKIAK